MIQHNGLMPEDEVLTEVFSELRDETRARTPSFEQVLRRARTKHSPLMPRRLVPIAAAVAVLAGTSWWFASHDKYPSIPDAYNVARWEAPTDFLLQSSTRAFGAAPVFGRPSTPTVTFTDPEQTPTTTDTSAERRMQL